jgi:hypothetical protein
MPTSSVAVCNLALAVLGLGAAAATFAQGSNVTAFGGDSRGGGSDRVDILVPNS